MLPDCIYCGDTDSAIRRRRGHGRSRPSDVNIRREHGRIVSGGRRILSMVGFIAVAVSVVACGTSARNKTEPVALTELNRCLVGHGIAHPENTPRPSPQELAVPSLIAIRGLRVPIGVTRTRFEGALKECGAGSLHVAPAPVTSAVLQERIVELRSCLARNEFRLPPPNFPGPGPVLDTSGVDIASARWVATATGCGFTRQLTQATLTKCMGVPALEGAAKTNPAFQRRYLGLARCLRDMG